ESLLFRARQRLRGSLRAAAAAAASLPGGMRDLFTQLLAGPPDGPATVAKLGSAPLLGKLASVGAGAAVLSAGATGVLPASHHRSGAAPARRTAAVHPRRQPHVRPAVVRAQPVVVAVRDRHRSETEPRRSVSRDERRDVAESSTPESEPRSSGSGRGSDGSAGATVTPAPTTSSSGPTETVIEMQSSDGR